MFRYFNTNPATVLTPSGKTHYPKIDDNKDGTVTIRYQPSEAGLHELDVRYNKEPIQGMMEEMRIFAKLHEVMRLLLRRDLFCLFDYITYM